MRVKTFFRVLRVISAIVLFFFVWTFGPIWQAVAFAAEKQNTPQVRSAERGVRKEDGPAERFEKSLDDIRQKLRWAEDKSREGVEPTPEIETIKTRKAEIESIDSELKAEFAATEKKLKDAHLPGEILERHYKFVKHYQDNLKELVANLEQVERAGTKAEVMSAVGKARGHLEKVKTTSRHQKLDPNNLPFRARKATKTREPRTKEQFKKDFPPQRSPRTANGQWIQDAEFTIHDIFKPASWTMHRASVRKPILVASNGSLSGLLSSESKPEIQDLLFSVNSVPSVAKDFDPQSVLNLESGILNLAQVAPADAPTAADLSETPEVQFTDAIRAKAQELGGNPVKIYEWVRNNIEYAPTYGSIQGADMCLQSKICNDMDTASLLIALFRVSGISAKYVYGTVEVPIEKAMNWVGGVTDPKMAGTVLATNGIPVTSLISGGTIKALQLEHVWVKAFIDYIPSRGAVQRQGNTWISLDASYKQYNFTQGIDIASAVTFDAQSFANQILSTATTNTIDGSITNVNSALVQQTMQDYQTQVQNYIQQSYPNATVGDVIGKKEIIQQNYPILLGTLPYKTVQVGSEFATVPDNLRETISFSIPDPTGESAGLTYTTGMPSVAGRKITLSYSPATVNDQAIIESLLPAPHADGTPIQPGELPSSLPAYLINLKSELRIDGQVVATGFSVSMGSAQMFAMSLNEPGLGLSNINNIIQAGEYCAIGLDIGRIGESTRNSIGSKLAATKARLDSKNYAGLTEDDLIGDLLYNTITTYFAELDTTDEISAMTMGVVRYRAPSVGMFSLVANVQEVFDVPISISSKGMMMDVDRIMQAVFSKDGNQDNVKLSARYKPNQKTR